MSILRSIACILAAIICSCCTSSNTSYVISVDPAFYSIDATGKEKNILAFLTDLTAEVSRRSKLSLQLQSANWDSLFSGLDQKQYSAVISGMPQYNFTTSLYSLSDIFLESGPVLVTRKDSSKKSLKKLSAQEVGIISDFLGVDVLEKYPEIIIRSYDLVPKMLMDLQNGVIQGAIVGIIPALGYTNDLYQNALIIASEPLMHEGLRLITRKDSEKHLMETFSKTVKQMEREGYINNLLRKWGLAL